MIKIITIVGARPQFVKAAAVSRVFKNSDKVEEKIIHTGQHFDSNMSDVFFEQMNIPKPNFNLGIHGLSHGAMTGQMLEKIEEVLIAEKPDWVMVYGDTNSTLAGALAAKKMHIKVAHVEAGLRSFNMKMPEEINRILTDRISDLLLCPTDTAIENLKKEGFENMQAKIVKTGDVMQDAAIYYAANMQKPEIDIPEKFVLATIHRAENTDSFQNLNEIFSAFSDIAKKMPVIIPLHPRTKNILQNSNIKFDSSRIQIIEPVGYMEMIYLLKNCSLVMTDSGGLQKEAYFFKKPCLTLRTETEWVELVKYGYNKVVGTNKENILNAFHGMLNKIPTFNVDLYGEGKASDNILKAILNFNK